LGAVRTEPAVEAPAWPDDAVEVGRIVGAWGLKGWIKVQPFTADPQALFSSRRWFLKPPEQAGGAKGAVKRPAGAVAAAAAALPSLLKIVEAKDHGELVVARLHDVADRDQAEALRGARVFIARSSFPTAGPDEFYWVDLIGLDVVNRSGERLGTVCGLIDTGPHSVLRVAPAPGAAEVDERLIPFVAAYVDEVSLEQRRITVDWGLDF
jgi:16S rRNA processing protein RimM